jgi:hypothetical protein
VTNSATTRQIHPVILTDRCIAGADLSGRFEWSVNDSVHTIYRPIGYRSISREVFVLAAKTEHLFAVEQTAIAIASIANVDKSDLDGMTGVHRCLKASKAMDRVHEAMRLVTAAFESKEIPENLYMKLFCLLNKTESAWEPFTKRWEVALLLYAGSVAEGVPSCYDTLFGKDTRSPVTVRQDQARGRKFIQSVENGVVLDCPDAPDTKVGLQIAQKYLTAITPLMKPELYKVAPITIKCSSLVTKRGGAVTKKPQQSTHVSRPTSSIPQFTWPPRSSSSQ